jgi:hypothetical protein
MSTDKTPPFSHKKYASSVDLEKLGQLGDEFSEGGKTYKLVQVHTVCTGGTANVISAGEVLYRLATENVVTNDRSEAVTDSANHYCGVAPADLSAAVPESTATTTYYMLMQVGGRNSAVVTNGDDDIAAGVQIIASGDGTCDSEAIGTDLKTLVIGISAAVDVDAANTVAVDMRYVGTGG